MKNREVNEKSNWQTLRSVIIPSPLLGLIFAAIVILIFAVFVFGDRGSLSNPNAAELLRTVGVGALAAVVTTVVDRSVSARDLERRISSNFREAAGVAASLTELGIYTAHADFDFGMIFREARKGETVSWLDTYCPRQNEFIDDVTGALRRGVFIRMLIINPSCENARFRNEELQSTVDTGGGWTSGLETFIAKMRAISGRENGRFEIRSYSDLPCVPMYLLGRAPNARKGYFSIFLVRATAQCQHIEIRHGELLGDMASYFEQKWSRQRPLEPV